jgi:small subunit ribosomal protein S4
MRYLGPKNRISRREGVDLELKTVGSKSHARLLKKLNVPPGQHGVRKRKKISERATQLREKQKLRYMFGITEKQLKKYFRRATMKKGNTALYLSQYLEKRLDNIIYHLGFVPTRASGRQLITHGHIVVNKKKVTIPSYQVRTGEEIGFVDDKTTKIPYVETSLNNKDVILPAWLEKKAITGRMISEPTQDVITRLINLRLIIEYYSR